MGETPVILAIESSCDETSAAVISGGKVLSNLIHTQLQHAEFGGVVPELASRLHQQRIVQVTEAALERAGLSPEALDAVAFTRGPGLLGALLVGVCFAKGYALGQGKPLIEVNHMQAHVLANFLSPQPPEFPFLCLTVSGGHTQLVLVRDTMDMEIIGQTMDDAAGEAFDKAAKMLGLPYPGGPQIDKLARQGDPQRFDFPESDMPGYQYSFSGIKTALLYFLRDHKEKDPGFIEANMPDICAGYQRRIVSYLLRNMERAATDLGVKHLAIAGGVSANSELRARFEALCKERGWTAHIPEFQYCTDNAGMIAIAAHFKYLAGDFAPATVVPFTRERFA